MKNLSIGEVLQCFCKKVIVFLTIIDYPLNYIHIATTKGETAPGKPYPISAANNSFQTTQKKCKPELCHINYL